jgi:prepilin-type N-terminal cleavage/methylation domain-containing protein
MINTKKYRKGFTLIELLIVVAVIAILAAIVFVALNPLKRFQDTRDSTRWGDVSAIVSAVKVDQVDNGGTYISAVDSVTAGDVYMIGTAVLGCDDDNLNCDTNVTADTSCIDISGLVTEGYLGSVPISQPGIVTWSAATTGYTLQKNSNGTITIRACESESSSEISVNR